MAMMEGVDKMERAHAFPSKSDYSDEPIPTPTGTSLSPGGVTVLNSIALTPPGSNPSIPCAHLVADVALQVRDPTTYGLHTPTRWP